MKMNTGLAGELPIANPYVKLMNFYEITRAPVDHCEEGMKTFIYNFVF